MALGQSLWALSLPFCSLEKEPTHRFQSQWLWGRAKSPKRLGFPAAQSDASLGLSQKAVRERAEKEQN